MEERISQRRTTVGPRDAAGRDETASSSASGSRNRSPARCETPALKETLCVSGGYFRRSLAAFLALSAPEPPPFFLPLDLPLDDDLPLEPFFELPPASSTAFLALSMYPDHAPFSLRVLSLFAPTVVLKTTRNRPGSFLRLRPPKPTEGLIPPWGGSRRYSPRYRERKLTVTEPVANEPICAVGTSQKRC